MSQSHLETNGIGNHHIGGMTGGDGPRLEQEQSRLFQGVNVRMKLECWSQFEVHGADQVVLSQKQ